MEKMSLNKKNIITISDEQVFEDDMIGDDYHFSEYYRKSRKRYIAAFFMMFIVLVSAVLLNLFCGSVHASVSEIAGIFTGRVKEGLIYSIIWELRLPRLFAAMILGGALAVSGMLLQTYFRNPIAGPYVLGISSGAKMAVAAVMIWCSVSSAAVSSAAMVAAAFAGSLLSMGLIVLVARVMKNMYMLIVGGIMIGYICNAITDFMVTFADDSNIVNLHNWTVGSFSGITGRDIVTLSAVIFPALIMVFLMSKQTGAFLLGEDYARSAGVNLRSYKFSVILLSSLLSACVTAYAGPVSFVGIAVPHIAKRMLGTSRPILVIPACFLCGAIFCLVCDLTARTAFAPAEVNLSSVTAVFGAPVVLYVLIRRKR